MIKTDAEGKANVSFTLPDNLTTFRLLALASSRGKYATKGKEFIVRTPVVVQPLMPRFIRPGDALEIGAVVINQTARDEEFELHIESPLLVFDASKKFEAQKRIRIPKGASKEVSLIARVNAKRMCNKNIPLRSAVQSRRKG
jgi:uncharacterized protein YfaS (alpha-2-macroglobulin family)